MSTNMSVQINADLIKERKKCTFDVEELINFIDGGKDKTEMRKYVENLVLSYEELRDDVPEEYLSHKECYENVVRKGALLFDIFLELSKERKQKGHHAPSNTYRINEGIMQNVNPFILHFALFVPNIQNQATAEQQSQWLRQTGMIGTYAQTELGHGTFLRGLETTATFDPETDEFVLNSPTLSSYKWWPGGLGQTCNHCLLMAQLYINGKCYGPHLFFVQIRHFETHEPLSGIKLGEIGAKMGFNTANNGFLGFSNFRIPRNNMLMKYNQVLRDGTYVKSKLEKSSYGSMVYGRVHILSDMAYCLARAATISVRYSAVRHQSHIKPDEPEVQVLNFASQQHKLFIAIATSHAFKVTGLWLWHTYSNAMKDIGKGALERSKEVHALSCCLKATSTCDAGELVERCRTACGGHGYLMSSNLPVLYTTVAAAITYEGVSTVLMLQTARFLVKSWKQAMAGEALPETVSFLSEYFDKKYNKWTNTPEGIINGFKAIAAGILKSAADKIQQYVANGLHYEEAWNLTTVNLVNASEAYSRLLLCEVFWRETQKALPTVSSNLAVVLEQLAELYLVYWALEKRGDFLMYSTISKVDIDILQNRYEELLALIRPNAVGLVDSFDIRDEILCSTLGSYDGRVYERIMEHALKSPLNAESVNQSFHKYIKPVMLKHKFGSIVMQKSVNIDLKKERAKCSFKIEELTNFLDDGFENTKRRRELEHKILSTKGILDEIPEEYLSHKEKYENAIRKSVILYRALQEHDDMQDKPFEQKIKANIRHMVSAAVLKDHSPFMLHGEMFLMTIQGQGNEEQQKIWLKRAINMEIIGTYAQTELGHGTFLRGLELQATYDEKTEEFILHSPSLTSYKWWPGGLAHTVNHAIVMAQLYIKGKSYGMQPFMVQIRDLETHMPLPGIKVGEIGPKLGFNTVNNGFLGFENFRIPRDRMLMKNAQVLKDGTFVASPNSKLAYGTMVYVRVSIVNTVANYLSAAVTIAVRYAAVRRQSQLRPDEPEPQILDYVTQQHKLIIAIATTHAYHFTVRWLYDVYNTIKKDLDKGRLDSLPELHVLACVLKVLSSSDCTVLIERCRLACGGHGYMLSSNLPQLYGVCTASCTYEGENTVLLLQVARSLVKAWENAVKSKPLSPSMAYLADKNPSAKWDNSLDGIIRNFQIVARGKVSSSVASFEQYKSSGLSHEDAWNKASVQLIAAAEAHGRVIVLSMYKMEIERRAPSLSPSLRVVLEQVQELYTVYWTLEKMGDLLLYTQLSESDVKLLQRRYEDLLAALRPNAVGLVDAFDIRDEILSSTLGAYDGRAYERLMEEALKSPLNKEPVNQSFQKYLKPFMQGKL